MRDIKLPQVRRKLAQLLTTRQKFVCFDVTSPVEIDYARQSLCQARQLNRESVGTEIQGSWVRVPRETDFISRIEKPQHNIEYHTTRLIMTLQFKTRHCNGILFRVFDVSLQFHNWQVCTYFCICKCLLFQFFCLKGCVLCMLQFQISHLNIRGSAYCLDCKSDIF